MKNLLALSLTAVFLFTFSCKPKAEQEMKNTSNDVNITSQKNSGTIQFSEKVQRNFMEYLEIYMSLKDALVESDFNLTKNASTSGFNRISGISTTNINDSGKDLLVNLKTKLESLSQAKNIENQRSVFEDVSELTLLISKNITLSSEIYVQYCPMAFNNKGAKWLSFDKKVMNPYFGDVMLHCGSVIEQF